jgi:hypothetical protein
MLVRTRRMRNFGIGAKLHKGSSNSNEDIEMSRDGNLHPTCGYPIQGAGFTRSIVLMGWGRVMF